MPEKASQGPLPPEQRNLYRKLAALPDLADINAYAKSLKQEETERASQQAVALPAADASSAIPSVSPRRFSRRKILGGLGKAAAMAVGGAALFEAGRLYQTLQDIPKAAAAAPDSPVASPAASTVAEASSKPEAPLSPLNEAAMGKLENLALKRRKQRRDQNPKEYDHRINTEINEDRVNILFYGYGETLENPPENPKEEGAPMGSHSIFSYNKKTGTWDVISLTHDIRAPEIENLQRQKGEKPVPTRLDASYKAGGFDFQRLVIEDATGLSIDFQVALPDKFIKGLVDNVFGKLKVDVPFDIDTYPFYQDGVYYPGGSFKKGPQEMDGIQVMQFVKAWSKSHTADKERNVRKHVLIKSLLKNAFDNKKNIGFWLKGLNYLRTESGKAGIDADFNLLDVIPFDPALLAMMATQKGGVVSEEAMKIDKAIYVVDPSAGGEPGAVSWVTLSKSKTIQTELKDKVIQDQYLEIPVTANANPHSPDLVTDYWKSLRDYIKSKLLPSARPPAPK